MILQFLPFLNCCASISSSVWSDVPERPRSCLLQFVFLEFPGLLPQLFLRQLLHRRRQDQHPALLPGDGNDRLPDRPDQDQVHGLQRVRQHTQRRRRVKY